MIQEEERKPFTSDELYEYRKVLVDWKWRGPDAVYFVLSQLCKGNLERDAIIQSKLYKSVYILRDSIKKAPIADLMLYNKDQIANILLKLKAIHNQIKEIVTKQNKKDNKKTVFSVSKFMDPQNITTISNIYHGDYLTNEQRLQIKTKLIDTLITSIKNKSQQELFSNIDIIQKSQQLAEQLEQTLYFKHMNTVAPQKNYSLDLKTLYQYLGKDKTGIIIHKLFEGSFTIQQALQLQIKDWLDEEFLREIENRNISQIQNDDADYYRQIRIKEMTQSKGQECPRCHNNYLYIIDMKQLRRADEPTTIFYECFACQHRYKV